MNNPPSAPPLDSRRRCFYDINRRPGGNRVTARRLSAPPQRPPVWLTPGVHTRSFCVQPHVGVSSEPVAGEREETGP